MKGDIQMAALEAMAGMLVVFILFAVIIFALMLATLIVCCVKKNVGGIVMMAIGLFLALIQFFMVVGMIESIGNVF